MIVHPLLTAVLVLDMIATLMLLLAARVALGVVLRWRPEEASREQLLLERRTEAASLHGRIAWYLSLLASAALVIGVAELLPGIVPGAMCGTGVLQAAGPTAAAALLLRLGALGALGAWRLLDRLSRASTRGTPAVPTARTLLVALPLQLLAVFQTTRSFWSLDVHQPVDCCAALYEQVAIRAADGATSMSPALTNWLTIGGAATLLLGTIWLLRDRRRSRPPGVDAILALVAVAWSALAAHATIHVYAAYHYEVLNHPCPWCLFSLEHRAVGYPLAGALLMAALAGPAVLIGALAGRRWPALAAPSAAVVRSALWRLVIAALVFAVLAFGPALAWRLRHGVWLG